MTPSKQKPEITLNRLRELLDYDPKSGIFKWKIRLGGASIVGSVAGGVTNRGYLAISISGKKYFAHRLAWLYMHGEFPDSCLDHVDRIRINNAIDNLRCCTIAENLQNLRLRKNNKSGATGVSFCTTRSKWRAKINLDGEANFLGYFAVFEDAVKARLEAKEKLHLFNPTQATS